MFNLNDNKFLGSEKYYIPCQRGLSSIISVVINHMLNMLVFEVSLYPSTGILNCKFAVNIEFVLSMAGLQSIPGDLKNKRRSSHVGSTNKRVRSSCICTKVLAIVLLSFYVLFLRKKQ